MDQGAPNEADRRIADRLVTRLRDERPRVHGRLIEICSALGMDLEQYFASIRPMGDDPNQAWQLVDDLRREARRSAFHGLLAENRNVGILAAASEIERALNAELVRPADLFTARIVKATSRLEMEYASTCAVSAAHLARHAIVAETRSIMASDRIRLETGILKASKVYARPLAASIWIEVLHANASRQSDDAFLTLARELAGMAPPADASHAELARIDRVKEELRRHGLLKAGVPAWNRDTVLAPATMTYLAGIGRAYDAWRIENPKAPASAFEHATRPHVMVGAEAMLWKLLDQSGLPTSAGLQAALHYAIVERERGRRHA